MNRLVLSARIAEIAPARQTPAGLPALDFRLEHESELEEAGQKRQVRASIRAVSFGAVAERLARQPMDSDWRFTGFIATGRNTRQPVFHVQDFEKQVIQE